MNIKRFDKKFEIDFLIILINGLTLIRNSNLEPSEIPDSSLPAHRIWEWISISDRNYGNYKLINASVYDDFSYYQCLSGITLWRL